MTSHPMSPALQVFAIRAAASDEARLSPYRNFLIIAPEPARTGSASHPPDERVTALAHHLTHDGYAYVARSSQKEMEDDSSGVRFLPLHEVLPSFAVMTAVVVINDAAWAVRAAATYPGADIFLLKLS